MSIDITCECGQKIRTAKRNAGREIKCPLCQTTLLMPRQLNPKQRKSAEIQRRYSRLSIFSFILTCGFAILSFVIMKWDFAGMGQGGGYLKLLSGLLFGIAWLFLLLLCLVSLFNRDRDPALDMCTLGILPFLAVVFVAWWV